MIFKSIVNGKLFTSNNEGVIEVMTPREAEEKWWSVKKQQIKEILK